MLKYALRSFYSSFSVALSICYICFSLTICGCSFSVDRATLCSYLFTSKYVPVEFDEKEAIGFYATNGYWQLNLMRLPLTESVYKIHLTDYYSQDYEVVLHDFHRCIEMSFFYPGVTSKGIWKGIRMIESKNSFVRRINFSCDSAMFDSETALINFLSAPWYNSRIRKLVSPEGILICIESDRNETMIDVTVEVVQLLVENKPPSIEVLRPHVNGNLRWHSIDGNVSTFFANIQLLKN